MSEEWRPVAHGSYEVSSVGRVRNQESGRVLRSRVAGKGYPMLTLCPGGVQLTVYVHHLVAAAFLGARPAGMQINHIDGNKANPAASNLEYVTPSENLRHAHRTGLRATYLPDNRGETNGQAKLAESDVRTIREEVAAGARRAEMAARFRVSPSLVDQIVQRSKWSHVS